MKVIRFLVGLTVAVFAASVAMFVAAFWTGEELGAPIYTMRLALVLILLCILIPLVSRMSTGTLPRRLWSLITVAIILAVIPVTMETVDAYAGRQVFSQDLSFLFYLLVFIPVLVGIMSTTELADLFVHLGYLFLVFAAYFQYEITTARVLE